MSEEPQYGYFPLGEFLGMSLETVSDGVVAEIDIGPKHLNPNGVAHGGVIFTMLDTAGASLIVPVGVFGSRPVIIRLWAPPWSANS